MINKTKEICKENEVEISISELIVPERFELFWYGGPIITLKYKNRELVISAIGDVCFDIMNKNGISCQCHYRNTNNTGVAPNSDVFDVITNDDEFESYIAVGLVNWINNNWIEYSIFENDKVIFHESDPDISNLNEVFTDILYYIQKLKKD